MARRSLALSILIVGVAGFGAAAFAQSGTGPLLQPGEPYPGTSQEPIHLHLPAHKAPEASAGVSSQSSASDSGSRPSGKDNSPVASGSGSAPQVDLIHPPRHKRTTPARLANTTPAAKPPATIPFSLDTDNPPLTPELSAAAQPAAGKSAIHPSAAAVRQASIAAPVAGDRPNMTKRGAILFEKGASSPSPAQYRGVKVLAENLNNALEKGAAAIQLEAYGGAPGDKSSDARRLSLRRALAVRQLLIDDGVPSARIDVRAMGGTDDKDKPDRVDVFIRTG